MAYECPDIVWQGPFAQVADALEKRTWEVWCGTFVALGAIAHKNLHWKYYKELYGMPYALLIADTGSGKSLTTDLCRALLPSWYKVRSGVQSGQGLQHLIADVTKNKKGAVENITVTPAVMLIEEWTALANASKIPYSILSECLNEVFQSEKPFDLTKAEGTTKIDNPILSICSTTTKSAFRDTVTPSMLSSGFLNRFLMLPGAGTKRSFYEEGNAVQGVTPAKGLFDRLAGRVFGMGEVVWEAYEGDAKARLIEFGTPLYNETVNPDNSTPFTQGAARLHFYLHLIPLLYTFGAGLKKVPLEFVEAGVAVLEVSRQFVAEMMGDVTMEIPKQIQYQMTIDDRILDYVKRYAVSGAVAKQKTQSALNRLAPSSFIGERIEALIGCGRLKVSGVKPRMIAPINEEADA